MDGAQKSADCGWGGADGTIWLVVADGREFAEASSAASSSTVGLSIEELRSVMVLLGAVDPINLDGGGSSAMVVYGRSYRLLASANQKQRKLKVPGKH